MNTRISLSLLLVFIAYVLACSESNKRTAVTTSDPVLCPICCMEATHRVNLTYGQALFFGCGDCKTQFIANPVEYVNSTDDAIPPAWLGKSVNCPVTGQLITITDDTDHITWDCGQLVYYIRLKTFLTGIQQFIQS